VLQEQVQEELQLPQEPRQVLVQVLELEQEPRQLQELLKANWADQLPLE
jgi:hypothetical protein